MGDFVQRPGSGTLFQNDTKGNDRAPAWKGELALEDGTILKLAGWVKQGRKGEFISLAIDKPRENAERDEFRSQGSSGVARGGRYDPEDSPF